MTRNHSTEKRRWLLLGLATLAAAFPSLINTKTIYATDNNTVSISVDQNAELKPVGNLHKATTNVTVKTGKPYGFNLTMQADTADLVNTKDQTHKISATPSSTPVALNANQWGYALNKSATTFSAVPAGAQATPAVIIDTSVKGKQAGCNCKDHCDTSVTFAANLDPSKLASGSYSTAITYTATAKPTPKPPVVEPTVCRSGDPKNDCQVDLDSNMIPVIYTGNENHAEWTSIKWPENPHDPGAWYNYNQKKWANAITVKDPSKYQNKRMVVDQADILGYWVYIPRYAYEVMRRDATDTPVPAQNFTIHFEKATDPKRYPAESKCAGRNMDYRTTCGLNRDYIKGQPSNQGTWATHPAFTFGTKELNGIWFAKFETTGTNTQPTVLPNEAHMSGYYTASYNIGRMYTTAKTLGVADNNNIGGNTDYTVPTQNNHHLAKLSSHMVNNNDWGAATYLSASKYGAGYNGVQINSQASKHDTGNGEAWGTTGCGPYANGDKKSYSERNDSWIDHKGVSVGALGTQQACSSDGTRAYNGTLGQLASTTNNPTGIYDMSGGGWEYVAASYTTNLNESAIGKYVDYFGVKAHPPYVNTYNFSDFNFCTYQTCGGQALHETNLSNLDGSNRLDILWNQWNNNYSHFVTSSYPWFHRGGHYYNDSLAGLFYANGPDGVLSDNYAFRVALAPLRD